MLIISHSGSQDGPNLSYNAGGYQPWSNYDPLGEADGNPYSAGGKFWVEMFRPRAWNFWSSVGRSLVPEGKIILLGCNLGMGYHEQVANASGRTTYGPIDQCAAGDATTAVRLVRGIERGEPATIIKRAEPAHR
jgi:hypothetical protein